MKPTKSCPVVIRNNAQLQILAFLHPIAGRQLVKGTIESGESADEAAIRELAEEAGILDAKIVSHLGLWKSRYQEQVWSFHLCEVDQEMPDEWVHHASDDGGHDFTFFLYPLAQVARSFSGSLGFHSHRSSMRLKPFASLTGVSEAPHHIYYQGNTSALLAPDAAHCNTY